MDTTDHTEGRRKRSLREQVYRGTKRSIITGELGPCTRLIEENPAEAVQASRTAVREAFQKLEKKEGLIYRYPRAGHTVRGVTEEEVDNVFGLRSVLERYAGFLAASWITREEPKNLKDIVRKEEACLTDMHAARLIDLDTRFHDVLHKAAPGKRVVIHSSRASKDYLHRYRVKHRGWSFKHEPTEPWPFFLFFRN